MGILNRKHLRTDLRVPQVTPDVRLIRPSGVVHHGQVGTRHVVGERWSGHVHGMSSPMLIPEAYQVCVWAS